MPAADGGQVGQLLDDDAGVVEGRLVLLADGVGHQHGQHGGQEVAQVPGGLAHQQGRGHRVGHRARERGRAWRGAGSGGGVGVPNLGVSPARGGVPCPWGHLPHPQTHQPGRSQQE